MIMISVNVDIQNCTLDPKNDQSDQTHFIPGPIVGLQIRRTDKIGTEAAFHSVAEYMKWAELWFQMEERRTSPPRTLKRRVFVATDDPNAVKEAREK